MGIGRLQTWLMDEPVRWLESGQAQDDVRVAPG
jgi:hypothetical protein